MKSWGAGRKRRSRWLKTITREALLEKIQQLDGWLAPQGYYIDSSDSDDHIAHHYTFCREHAQIVAKYEALETGASMYIADAWSGDDSIQRCAFGGCDIELYTGGLTDDGVDSALALTERNPLACSVTLVELMQSANVMADNDPRWAMWIKQAQRTLRYISRRR